ncbi:MAG: CoB--CoM heterodisulfide reductase iron-sulfur subunit A family protein [Ignavibacteriae bacterium]|nr:MAG: CoB--CoM heterodisulfide reductase iron-sulfur subunit A family protein [Ignavibacteriota bacterium]
MDNKLSTNGSPNGEIRIGFFICHCGVNISTIVNVAEVRDYVATLPHVVVSKDYKFMCSDPGQEIIINAVKTNKLNRVVVAACSPLMHEGTFRGACEKAGINKFLFQMANIREHCSWVHDDKIRATEKAKALAHAAVKRVSFHVPMTVKKAKVNPDTLIVGGGISGIQAALDIADSGNNVYLVEREPSIGGKMALFDKTFPTLDCSACILTPKMVSVGHRDTIKLYTWSEVVAVSGFLGNFKVTIKKKARYVDTDKCTGCGQCWSHCPATRFPSKRQVFFGDKLINEKR